MSGEPNAATPSGDADRAPRRLSVSASPHIRSPESVPRIMWSVSATLLPAGVWGVRAFGPRGLWVMFLAIAAALAAEAACQALRRRPITVGDGSAFLTGLLVAFVLPVHVPWYVPVTASVFAIAVVKQAFGGLGCNIWNPALMGRAFVMAAWAALVTVGAGWPVPFARGRPRAQAEALAARPQRVDAVTAPTPLTRVEQRLKDFNRGRDPRVARPKSRRQALRALRQLQGESAARLGDLFVGRVGGCLGEVSALALLAGGLALLLLGYVRWEVPAFFIGTVALLGWALPIPVEGEQARYLMWFAGRPLFEVLAGGLFLGAFYMATDMVTSPLTRRGNILFAIGCGVLTAVIRRYGGYPEGVCYAILLMNTARPLIDRHTTPRVFGQRAKP